MALALDITTGGCRLTAASEERWHMLQYTHGVLIYTEVYWKQLPELQDAGRHEWVQHLSDAQASGCHSLLSQSLHDCAGFER